VKAGRQMTDDQSRFEDAIRRFDAANAEDPNRSSFEGKPYPKELLYAQRMTEWLKRLAPGASEPLRLAARCQHVRRWEIPRDSFPMDRSGYLAWRKRLYRFHADTAESILRDVGYDDSTIARVRSLLQKEKIKLDPEMQTLEDVICLVFLENYFADFARDRDEQQMLNIIRRTWAKMSQRGHEAALTLTLSDGDRALIAKALNS
jgi:hypothetical protein